MSRFNRSTRRELDSRVRNDAVANARREREIRETAETLVEDRGRGGALAWAEHCMVRDPSGGFWRAVRDAIASSPAD